MPALGSLGSRQKHSLPDLPYDYGALEPHISAQIMQLHHSKHHATYVNNLNAVEEKYLEALEKGRRGAGGAGRGVAAGEPGPFGAGQRPRVSWRRRGARIREESGRFARNGNRLVGACRCLEFGVMVEYGLTLFFFPEEPICQNQ